jgi:hypothetical protein
MIEKSEKGVDERGRERVTTKGEAGRGGEQARIAVFQASSEEDRLRAFCRREERRIRVSDDEGLRRTTTIQQGRKTHHHEDDERVGYPWVEW